MNDATMSNCPFLFFYSDRSPTSDEPDVDAQGFYTDPDWLFSWWNQTTDDVFFCVNDTSKNLVWKRILLSDVDANGVGAPLSISNGGTSSTDAASARVALGFSLNSERNYKNSSLINFGDVVKPNPNQDILVVASIQMKNATETSSQITANIETESDKIAVSTISMEGINGVQTQSMTFIVPAGASYNLQQNGNGENAIISVYELAL